MESKAREGTKLSSFNDSFRRLPVLRIPEDDSDWQSFNGLAAAERPVLVSTSVKLLSFHSSGAV